MKLVINPGSLLWYDETGEPKQVERTELTQTEESAIETLFSFAKNYKSPEEKALEEVVKAAAETVEPDKLILLVSGWKTGEQVAVGDLRQYGGEIYTVVQAHTTQDDWRPDTVPALWSKHNKTSAGAETKEWVRPTGTHDAYQIGDQVIFEGKTYESVINANTWSPTEYAQGWKEK